MILITDRNIQCSTKEHGLFTKVDCVLGNKIQHLRKIEFHGLYFLTKFKITKTEKSDKYLEIKQHNST